MAYSPGVAAACDAIVEDPGRADELTARANLVAVITNGTAVLGLGNIGPLAAAVRQRSGALKRSLNANLANVHPVVRFARSYLARI